VTLAILAAMEVSDLRETKERLATKGSRACPETQGLAMATDLKATRALQEPQAGMASRDGQASVVILDSTDDRDRTAFLESAETQVLLVTTVPKAGARCANDVLMVPKDPLVWMPVPVARANKVTQDRTAWMVCLATKVSRDNLTPPSQAPRVNQVATGTTEGLALSVLLVTLARKVQRALEVDLD